MPNSRLAMAGRHLMAVGAVTVFLAFWGVVATMFSPLDGENPQKVDASGGWGGEAVTAESDGFSPIADANACGLGASSCYKCHNGQRAEAPGDKGWHTDHAKVNHSCAGCHNGNPRLLKKSISHRGMMPNPVESPETACFDCHQDSNAKALVDRYRQQLAQGE